MKLTVRTFMDSDASVIGVGGIYSYSNAWSRVTVNYKMRDKFSFKVNQ